MYACIGDPMCKTNHFVVNKELLCSMLLYRRHTNVTCNHVIEGSHMCFASVDIVTEFNMSYIFIFVVFFTKASAQRTDPQLSIMVIYNNTWSILIQRIRVILSGDNLT